MCLITLGFETPLLFPNISFPSCDFSSEQNLYINSEFHISGPGSHLIFTPSLGRSFINPKKRNRKILHQRGGFDVGLQTPDNFLQWAAPAAPPLQPPSLGRHLTTIFTPNLANQCQLHTDYVSPAQAFVLIWEPPECGNQQSVDVPLDIRDAGGNLWVSGWGRGPQWHGTVL